MPSRDDVQRAARLAQLSLNAAELDRMTTDLNEILSHVELLQQYVRDDGSSPVESFHAGMVGVSSESDAGIASGSPEVDGPARSWARLRPDTPGADPLSIAPSYLAPEWRDGFFTVPRLPTHDTKE